MNKTVSYVNLHGTPFERGEQHGKALAESLRSFVDDGRSRIDSLTREPLTSDSLEKTINTHKAVVEEYLPDIAREVEGLAVGAGISLQDAWMLQLRREIIGYSRMTLGDCSTFASVAAEPILAQTVDLNGNLDDFISVLDIRGSAQRSLVLSYGGLLGYLGINDGGLAVGLNLVLGGAWQPGIPPYLAIRHLLDTVSTVEDAVEILRTLPLSSSRSFTLCDRNQALAVEVLGDELRILEISPVAHTNHFLHPDFASDDQINVFARNSSNRRLDAISQLASLIPNDEKICFNAFSLPPLCVSDIGDIRRERTVSAVVMYPGRGEMYLRPGDPSLSETIRFSLN
ncbi:MULTISPECIES: C45 family peptidase [unclassified Pseudomonas]|uniref:C45 family autoproteolytic acyltransferase/hydolase n=1 Tax=unclassified Pseudomonas TaxID=196821 RepID=UPI00209E3406|nr:C45 family peptidase [Pseudomonas sp. FP1742]MCP1446498.1 putative choloylglycine hydrolase [Pseudomonas sp. GGS8]WLG48864.1 C45 family autoproteolytic acyltransferase/hydrolase [Pseudomonas sp. FP1742]